MAQGNSYLPPSNIAPATPKPTPAANSGKDVKFPTASSGSNFPLRSGK